MKKITKDMFPFPGEENVVTPKAAAELADMGFEVPADCIREPGPDAIYVTMRIMEGEEPKFPGNIFSECAWCHHKVQHRPHAPKGLTMICMECAFEFESEKGTIQ